MIKISNGVLSLQPPIFMLIFKSTYFYISTVDTSSVDGTYMLTLTIVNNHLKNEQIEPIFNRAVWNNYIMANSLPIQKWTNVDCTAQATLFSK